MTDEQIKTMDTARLCKAYGQGQRDCFGRGWSGAAILQDKIANELLSRGVTHIPNIFGPIEIISDWRGFQSRQRYALTQRHTVKPETKETS
jgi:hypothetical protein